MGPNCKYLTYQYFTQTKTVGIGQTRHFVRGGTLQRQWLLRTDILIHKNYLRATEGVRRQDVPDRSTVSFKVIRTCNTGLHYIRSLCESFNVILPSTYRLYLYSFNDGLIHLLRQIKWRMPDVTTTGAVCTVLAKSRFLSEDKWW